MVKIKGGRGSDPFSIAFRHFFTKKINFFNSVQKGPKAEKKRGQKEESNPNRKKQ